MRIMATLFLAGLAAMAPCCAAAGAGSGAFQVLITLRSAAPVLPPLGNGPEVTPVVQPAQPAIPLQPGPVDVGPGSAGGGVPGGPGQGQPPGQTPPPGQTASVKAVPQGGICINQGLSQVSGALVRVACSSGQFVGIEAMPNTAFLGVHGGAYRYAMAAPVSRAQAGGGLAIGGGTITALRVVQLGDADGVLQMLVSF